MQGACLKPCGYDGDATTLTRPCSFVERPCEVKPVEAQCGAQCDFCYAASTRERRMNYGKALMKAEWLGNACSIHPESATFRVHGTGSTAWHGHSNTSALEPMVHAWSWPWPSMHCCGMCCYIFTSNWTPSNALV